MHIYPCTEAVGCLTRIWHGKPVSVRELESLRRIPIPLPDRGPRELVPAC